MAGLVNAMVTGQNLAPKARPVIPALAPGATLLVTVEALNQLLVELKANDVIKK